MDFDEAGGRSAGRSTREEGIARDAEGATDGRGERVGECLGEDMASLGRTRSWARMERPYRSGSLAGMETCRRRALEHLDASEEALLAFRA